MHRAYIISSGMSRRQPINITATSKQKTKTNKQKTKKRNKTKKQNNKQKKHRNYSMLLQNSCCGHSS